MQYKLLEIFNFFDNNTCNKIISYAENQIEEQGKLYNGLTDSKLRNNRIVWYNISDQYQEWVNFLKNFDSSIDWIETPQISFYKPGEFFEYHRDSNDKSKRTHIRYLTLTANLQIAEGAYIEVEDKKFVNMQKGQAIVFLSSCQHRAVSPIQGERISFTIWGMAKNPNKK
jgi:predicted 2-oxoglutarate/Fe(II)-dependent dioxygenase YbiX